MAIVTTVILAAAAYAVFHKKINRIAKSIAAGVEEFTKIVTRSVRK